MEVGSGWATSSSISSMGIPMNPVEVAMLIAGAVFGVLAAVMTVICCVLAIFLVDKADHYYGVKDLRLLAGGVKGLPFSLARLQLYGLLLHFFKVPCVRRVFAEELELIKKSAA